MSFSVKIKQSDTLLPVEMGDTILTAALAADVPYPHGCQSGNCGACKSRLYSGEIEMSPYSDYALTDEEKDFGLILACRAGSKNNEIYRKWGIKQRTNEDMLADYINRARDLVEGELGLTLPDVAEAA